MIQSWLKFRRQKKYEQIWRKVHDPVFEELVRQTQALDRPSSVILSHLIAAIAQLLLPLFTNPSTLRGIPPFDPSHSGPTQVRKAYEILLSYYVYFFGLKAPPFKNELEANLAVLMGDEARCTEALENLQMGGGFEKSNYVWRLMNEEIGPCNCVEGFVSFGINALLTFRDIFSVIFVQLSATMAEDAEGIQDIEDGCRAAWEKSGELRSAFEEPEQYVISVLANLSEQPCNQSSAAIERRLFDLQLDLQQKSAESLIKFLASLGHRTELLRKHDGFHITITHLLSGISIRNTEGPPTIDLIDFIHCYTSGVVLGVIKDHGYKIIKKGNQIKAISLATKKVYEAKHEDPFKCSCALAQKVGLFAECPVVSTVNTID
jgi:hypothetical protein